MSQYANKFPEATKTHPVSVKGDIMSYSKSCSAMCTLFIEQMTIVKGFLSKKRLKG